MTGKPKLALGCSSVIPTGKLLPTLGGLDGDCQLGKGPENWASRPQSPPIQGLMESMVGLKGHTAGLTPRWGECIFLIWD